MRIPGLLSTDFTEDTDREIEREQQIRRARTLTTEN